VDEVIHRFASGFPIIRFIQKFPSSKLLWFELYDNSQAIYIFQDIDIILWTDQRKSGKISHDYIRLHQRPWRDPGSSSTIPEKKDRIPEGEDALKYLSKKDRAIVDKGMKRLFGFGVEGPPPFIPWNEWRERQKTDASSVDGS
jgi:hypothetical protein